MSALGGSGANPDAYTDRFVLSEAAAGTYVDARNRRILEKNRRQIAEAEQRQREREERDREERERTDRGRQGARTAGLVVNHCGCCTYLLTNSMT